MLEMNVARKFLAFSIPFTAWRKKYGSSFSRLMSSEGN